MRNYRLWGRIEQLAPAEFFVIVTAVRDDDPGEAHHVHHISPSREAADQARQKLMIEAGDVIAARGDRVVDVEVD